ncbi:MAG: glutamate 5-kinase [Solirubrobacterales bacterium]
MESYRKNYLKNIKRIVVKVGTSTLTHNRGLLNLYKLEPVVRQLAELHNRDYEIILVTSGAISAGMGKLNLQERPKTIPESQAAAAVGQGILLHMYEKLFSEYGKTVAQLLLTKDDIYIEERANHARDAFSALLKLKVIPIINENDAVAVDEIKFGDNDTLSALVAQLTDADLLIILSDIEGLYDLDPRSSNDAKLINMVDEITPEIEALAGGAGTELGTGGMVTKINAGKIAAAAGVEMVIAEGSDKHIIYKIMEGQDIGTWFKSGVKK